MLLFTHTIFLHYFLFSIFLQVIFYSDLNSPVMMRCNYSIVGTQTLLTCYRKTIMLQKKYVSIIFVRIIISLKHDVQFGATPP